MKQVKGLTNRIVAMLMSGMLVVGAVPGTVLASELQADFGQASEIAAEVPEGADTEEVSAEAYNQDDVAQEEEAAQYYTVTLDANGGYFVNEWDDTLGETVERTEILNKVIPSGGTVNNIVPIKEQENAVANFLGWSLERDGEDIWAEYAPAEDCTLYAVWRVETAEDTTVGEAYVPETDAAQNEDTAPEMDAAVQEEDTVSDPGAAQDTVDYDSGTDAVEDAASQGNYETAKEAEAAQASGDTDAAEGPEAGATPEKTNKAEIGTSDKQNTTAEQKTTHTLTDSADAEEETVREDTS